MKYLENINLELLSTELSQIEFGGGLQLYGRIELYSTKKAGNEKKESKLLDKKFEGATPVSPPSGATSAIPPMMSHSLERGTSLPLKDELPDKKLRKILIDLIQTMNASQVYRDFSQLSVDSFVTFPNCSFAIQNINSLLAEISLQNSQFLQKLWNEINGAFDSQLQKCKVYHLVDPSYHQEITEEGAIWSFDYFFCHEELRRICYFSCKAIYKHRLGKSRLLGTYSDDEEDDEEGVMADSEDEGMHGGGEDDFEKDSEESMDWR